MQIEPQTHEFSELLAMIEDLKKRVDKLESPESAKNARAQSSEEVELYCSKCGLTRDDAKWFWSKMECSGWRNDGKVVRSWHHCITAWKLANIFPSQKHNGNGHTPSVYSLKTTLDVIKGQMKELAEKYYNDSGAFHEWTSEPKRQDFIRLKRKAKEIEAKIAGAL